MKLGSYLAAPRPPFDYVQSDCCRWIDRWCQLRGWGSPMAAIGIQYDSERSALLQIKRGGGLASLWARGMEAVGATGVDQLDLAAGDVGVIFRPTECGLDEAAAIWTGERWATLGLRGLDFGPAETRGVWRG